MITLEVEGLEEISRRFGQHVKKFDRVIKKTLEASLLKIWEIVGRLGYPPPPVPSSYKRTGKLGETLGTSEMGGKTNKQPDIYKIEQFGNVHEASYGTRLKYAPYVIGRKQAWMHKLRWWTLPGTVVPRVKPEIEKLFKAAADEMARWLDGKGL